MPARSVQGHQGAQALRQVFDIADAFDGGEARFFGWMVFERLQVERVNLLVVALAGALVEALAALFAEPSALDHLREEGRQHEALAPRIVGDQLVKIARDMRPDIQADDIEQAIAGALGQSDQRAGERVDLFDGEAIFDGQLLDGGAEEAADAVGDEVGSVLARHHALAEMAVGEMGDEVPAPRG